MSSSDPKPAPTLNIMRRLVYHGRYDGKGLKTPDEQLKIIEYYKRKVEGEITTSYGYGVAFWMNYPPQTDHYQILLYIFDDAGARKLYTEWLTESVETVVINFTTSRAPPAPKSPPREYIDLEQHTFDPKGSTQVPLTAITGLRHEKRFFVLAVENKAVTTGNLICVNGLSEDIRACALRLSALAGTLSVRRVYSEWNLKQKPYDPKKHLCLEDPTSEATILHLLADVFAPSYHEEISNRGCSIEELCSILGFDKQRTSIACEVYRRIYGAIPKQLRKPPAPDSETSVKKFKLDEMAEIMNRRRTPEVKTQFKQRTFDDFFPKKPSEPAKKKVETSTKKRNQLIGTGKSISCTSSNDEEEESESGELSGSFIDYTSDPDRRD